MGARSFPDRSFGQRRAAEERQRIGVGLAEKGRVDVPDLAGAIEPAQGTVDEQTEVLVAPLEPESQGVAGALQGQADPIARSRAAACHVPQDWALAGPSNGKAIHDSSPSLGTTLHS